VSNSSTLWLRKCFCEFHDFAVLNFFPLGCVKPVSSCRDDEEPQSNTAATPSVQAVIHDKPSVQETELSAEAPRVTRSSIKKITVSRSTKRARKSKEADVSLEAHEPTSSSGDVSDRTLKFFPFALRTLICSCLARR
jgi:hypothetical protein